jgi:N-acylglucosamine-6-phosphate 2-epimerase
MNTRTEGTISKRKSSPPHLVGSVARKGPVGALFGGLVVSCQAPEDSPLNRPDIISALAQVAEEQGAVGVRINGEANIRATRKKLRIPIIGIEKVRSLNSPVYITPTFESLWRTAKAGPDIVAVDFTERVRPDGQSLEDIVNRARNELGIPIMADVATLDQGLHAHELGASLIGTTLYGYTEETSHLHGPAFGLLRNLVRRVRTPVILEGGIRSPEDVRRAFSLGAHAVVVGRVITNLEWLVHYFVEACPRKRTRPSRLEFE